MKGFRSITSCVLLYAAGGVLAGAAAAQTAEREERIIGSAGGLPGICREEAEARYAGLGEPVYQ